MSRAQEQFDIFLRWFMRGTVAVAAYFIVAFISEMRADVKSLLNNQAIMWEKVNRIERTIDRLEDYDNNH